MSQSEDEFLDSMKDLVESLRGIEELGVAYYAPIVESIIRDHCRDVRHIERTLDSLLGFAGHPDGLLLYRRLCRHYWDIDPAATADYVNAYRKMWDSDEEDERGPNSFEAVKESFPQ